MDSLLQSFISYQFNLEEIFINQNQKNFTKMALIRLITEVDFTLSDIVIFYSFC